ncbi:HTH domain-containing protein [Sphingomonas sp. SFZ2018-12]|nr:HTH domain-containing protein [Sphingomonas sp. SFZ2018-12]
MRRAERLFEILQILRRVRTPLTAETIASELEVSKRSVYRDIAALLALRVPIRGEAGVGYVLERGFDLPPLMLTPDELDAAILGANWVLTRGEPEMALAARNLIAKLEAVVPEELRGQIAVPTTSVAPVPPSADLISSASLRRAIRDRRKVHIVYRDSLESSSERTIWPVMLGYRDAGRILAAWCELRGDFRFFRTDRMLSMDVLEQVIPERAQVLRTRWRDAMDKERERYVRAEDDKRQEQNPAAAPKDC